MGSSFLEEIDRLQKGVTDIAVASVEEYFKDRPGVESMLRWLEVRAERELGAAQMISMAVVKFEKDIDKKFLVNLGKFIWDETRHYRDLGRFIEGLREAMPPEESPLVQPPEPETEWWDTLWRNVERERLAPFAGFYISEGSALAITQPLVAGCRKYGYGELADIYTRFGHDEEFHVALDRAMMDRYALTPRQQDLVLETATEVARYLRGAWAAIFTR